MNARMKPDTGDYLLGTFSVLVLLFLLAPIVIIVAVSGSPTDIIEFPPSGISLQWYQRIFHDPMWIGATRMSFTAAFLTAIASLVLGIAASIALVRGSFYGKNTIRIFLMSPLVVPKIIIAIGLYFLYVKLRIVGTLAGLVAAHTVIAMPYVVMIMSAAFFGLDRRLEWAASSLGASPMRTLWLVVFPLLRPAILSSALFAFIASFDDIILSLFLTKLSEPTLPRQIWVNVQQIIDPSIAAVATLMTAVSVLGLGLLSWIQRGPARRKAV